MFFTCNPIHHTGLLRWGPNSLTIPVHRFFDLKPYIPLDAETQTWSFICTSRLIWTERQSIWVSILLKLPGSWVFRTFRAIFRPMLSIEILPLVINTGWKPSTLNLNRISTQANQVKKERDWRKVPTVCRDASQNEYQRWWLWGQKSELTSNYWNPR